MIYWRLFKNKWFLIILVVVSFSAAIISYFLNQKHMEELNAAENAICVEFRDLKHPSIWGIKKLKHKDQYLKVMLDTTVNTHNNIPTSVVENNQKVKILGYSNDSILVNVAIMRKKGTPVNPQYEELWLWNKFIKMK